MSDVTLHPFTAEDVDWLVDRHRVLYARDEGFDDSFGDLVAKILTEFLATCDPTREAGWIAWDGDRRLGSIFCVAAGDTTAKLRLFLLDPAARGRGLGRQLLDHCTGFARDHGYTDMVLWTHESHKAACALYARAGWRLMTSKPTRSFGVEVVEQHWQRAL